MRTSGFLGSRVHAQKEVVRGVSVTPGSPWMLLNHCRSVSTRDTMAIGTWKMLQSCKPPRHASNRGNSPVMSAWVPGVCAGHLPLAKSLQATLR